MSMSPSTACARNCAGAFRKGALCYEKRRFFPGPGGHPDDFVARAHEPVRPRRAAPNRRRWCAAACLCLVTATAVLLTARYLPLKDYKDGDTNYSPSQPITNYQIGVEACYKAPDPGEYFCFVEVNAARKQYAGRNVKVPFRNGCIPKWGTGSRRKPGR